MSEWKKLALYYYKRSVRMTQLYENEFKRNWNLNCLIEELEEKCSGIPSKIKKGEKQ